MTRRVLLIAVFAAWAGCVLAALSCGANTVLWTFHKLGESRFEYAPATSELIARLCWLAALVAVLAWYTLSARRRWGHEIDVLADEQVDALDRLHDRWVDSAIAGSAALSLVLELVLIRWQGATLPVFAFYKNFGVLACFAGLGLGYALSGRRQIPLLLSIPLLGWQMALFGIFVPGPTWRSGLSSTLVLEQLNMGSWIDRAVLSYLAMMLLLAVTFLLTALAFVPVGQVCGRLMDRRADKLGAYGLNLLGSLGGIILMFGLSFLWTPPVIWFSVCFGGILAFQSFSRRALALGIGCSLLGIVLLSWPRTFLWEQVYSPYQLVERGPGERGLSILKAGGFYHQRINDLSSEAPASKPVTNYYEFPYRAAGKPGDVVVVGAGTGNDVAGALRMGANHVDAIEIDPVIEAIGSVYHPNDPYHDPRVRTIINDARTYLRTTDRAYDMIVYGLLDSHTLLSSASNVRLDSFVYTVEALRESRARLKDGGVLSLSFCLLSPEMGRKFYLMLEQAFDQPPVCIEAGYDKSVIFLVRKGDPLKLSPGLCESSGFREVTARFADPALLADVSTDDWPFLYMPRRVYPFSYLAVVAMLLVLAMVLTWGLAPARPRRSQAPFFFLGAGFMLVETKGITELGLTFGNTWQVIGVVIAAILAMAFLANWCAQKWGFVRAEWFYLLLLGSLALGWFLAGQGGSSSSPLGRLAAVVVLTIPMFFSGLVFSTLLRSHADLSGAMAANLIGVILGGILEYNSMCFGFRVLYLIAMVLYSAAYLTSRIAAVPSGESVAGFAMTESVAK
jgi:hypothetical protein